MNRPQDVLTAKEAALTKGVHINSLYQAIKDGRLKAEKRGGTILIRRRDLDAWQVIGNYPKGRPRTPKARPPPAPPAAVAAAPPTPAASGAGGAARAADGDGGRPRPCTNRRGGGGAGQYEA